EEKVEAVNQVWSNIKAEIEAFDPDIEEKHESFLARFYHANKRVFASIAEKVRLGQINPFVKLNIIEVPVWKKFLGYLFPKIIKNYNIEDDRMEELDREIRLGFLPIAGNPPNRGHEHISYMAQDGLGLDVVIMRVQGKISYKNLLRCERVSASLRHFMSSQAFGSKYPLMRYTNLCRQWYNAAEGAESMHHFLAMNKDKNIHLFYLIGAENEKRMWNYMRQHYNFFKKFKFGTNPNHNVTFAVIQRGEYGKTVTVAELEKISAAVQKETGCPQYLQVALLQHPDIDLNVSSTYYRNTQDGAFVPLVAHEESKKRGLYGHPLISFWTRKPIAKDGDEYFLMRLGPIAKKLAKQINKIVEENTALADTVKISIDGGSGSGKTTIATAVSRSLKENYGLETIVISLDHFLVDRKWRIAIGKLVTGWPIDDAEKKLIGKAQSDIKSKEAYLKEEMFFDNAGIIKMMKEVEKFLRSKAETYTLRIPDAYIRGERARKDIEIPLRKGVVIIFDGKYANREELWQYYNLRYRLHDAPDRTKARFEIRSRKMNWQDADIQCLFYALSLMPSYEVYDKRTESGINGGFIDLRGDKWYLKNTPNGDSSSPIEALKKCLVLDCDGVLWSGIVGEDGIEGIQLTPEHLELQKKALDLKNKGILLAINSKNNLEDVIEAFHKLKGMVLNLSDFAVIKINWQDKATNTEAIARELDIGLDSLVFLDDSGHERKLVKKIWPDVSVPELPLNPEEWPQILDDIFALAAGVTDEDSRRTELYESRKLRDGLRNQAASLEDHLSSLDMKVVIRKDRENIGYVARIAQLSQRTNQFNPTTRRYSEEDIRALIASDKYEVFTLQLKHKITDEGIVGLIILSKDSEDTYEIDAFCLSCRAIGLTVEKAFIAYIANELQSKGARLIKGVYVPTSKNKLVEDLYSDVLGFEITAKQPDKTIFSLTLQDSGIRIPYWFSIKNDISGEIINFIKDNPPLSQKMTCAKVDEFSEDRQIVIIFIERGGFIGYDSDLEPIQVMKVYYYKKESLDAIKIKWTKTLLWEAYQENIKLTGVDISKPVSGSPITTVLPSYPSELELTSILNKEASRIWGRELQQDALLEMRDLLKYSWEGPQHILRLYHETQSAYVKNMILYYVRSWVKDFSEPDVKPGSEWLVGMLSERGPGGVISRPFGELCNKNSLQENGFSSQDPARELALHVKEHVFSRFVYESCKSLLQQYKSYMIFLAFQDEARRKNTSFIRDIYPNTIFGTWGCLECFGVIGVQLNGENFAESGVVIHQEQLFSSNAKHMGESELSRHRSENHAEFANELSRLNEERQKIFIIAYRNDIEQNMRYLVEYIERTIQSGNTRFIFIEYGSREAALMHIAGTQEGSILLLQDGKYRSLLLTWEEAAWLSNGRRLTFLEFKGGDLFIYP
ncbi:MAG: HAD-IIIC family phosphatase, partial [Candidatus Omnitrophota bacterium]